MEGEWRWERGKEGIVEWRGPGLERGERSNFKLHSTEHRTE